MFGISDFAWNAYQRATLVNQRYGMFGISDFAWNAYQRATLVN
jgi:hypothetical protein